MGYKHSYSAVEAFRQIRGAGADCINPRTDSFIAWGVKQDLYQLKWMLDDILKECPSFGQLETDWLKEQEQKRIIKYLKDDIQ